MPKKPKIDKRLDKLFKEIQPEDSAAKTRRTSKVDKDAAIQIDPKPAQQKTEAVRPPRPRKEIHTAILPSEVITTYTKTENEAGSSIAVNFQTGGQDWSTLRVLDETQHRNWTPDEQLLIKQVIDQLSLALENARLFQETQQALESTRYRAEAENLINDIATDFLNVNEPQFINEVVNRSLGKLGTFLSIDRAYIFLFDPNGQTMDNTHEWRLENVASYINDFRNVSRNSLPFMMQSLSRMEPFVVSTILDMPASASAERDEYLREGIQSILCAPIALQNRPVGFVGLDSVSRQRNWTEEDIVTLRLFGQIAISALDRAQNQEALAKSEADLRVLFSSMEDVVLVYDRDGRYVRIAPTNPARLIKPPEELVGRLIHEVLPKETADRFQTAIKQTLDSGESTQLEYDLTIGNESYWFLANLTKLDNENVFWVARDITERKIAEDAIRRRNEYLAVSAEIGKLVTSTLDLNSIFARTVNLINDRFNFYYAGIYIVEETGFNAILREATGAGGAELKRQNHSHQVNAKSVVGKVASDGQPIVINSVTANPLFKPNPWLPDTKAEAAIPLRIGNRIIGALDIQAATEDAFTEDNISVLQTLADQVAVAIDNARSFELSQQAVMEMREIDRLKSQFLANMSHELRTPLNSIIGFSRVILKGIDGPVTELQQQDLTAIYNSGQHLLGLINDVLDLAKIEAGKMELAFDEVNMADVTNSVMSTMSGLVKDRPVELKRIIEPDLPTVRADAIRIRQVMINLLSNASKFTDEGDIVVEVSTALGATGRKEVMVSVTDTGPGISREDQTKLFQAFSQVDDSPTRKTGGTGLGLSICQELINMHGGRIWVESEIGKGSKFNFTLPLFHKESEGGPAIDGNKVILAIDDDPQVIGLYERYLHPQGYQVIPLTDPTRALERVKQLKPFAVTLDIMMPGIDGWQVLDNLKADPDTRNTPVIVCSIIEDLEKGFNLGASDYLVKPILEDDIVNALDRLNSDGSIREVLVIDDNPDDLRLIGRILDQDGRYKAILAEGGRSGWNIISSGNPPHAIIIDLFMPELNGFQILENMQADIKLRDIPVIVISGLEITAEQKIQLNDFGQRLLSKGAFSEKELLTSIQRALERIQSKN